MKAYGDATVQAYIAAIRGGNASGAASRRCRRGKQRTGTENARYANQTALMFPIVIVSENEETTSCFNPCLDALPGGRECPNI